MTILTRKNLQKDNSEKLASENNTSEKDIFCFKIIIKKIQIWKLTNAKWKHILKDNLEKGKH